VWLDGRKFPTILATARGHGVDPVTELIPVAPAQHYASGGVSTDLWGRSGVPGLYATGEVACSGVHGANRLASNSLLEGLVFSRRIAEVLPAELRHDAEPAVDRREPGVVEGAHRRCLQDLMTDRVGVLRTSDGINRAAAALAAFAAEPAARPDPDSWETTNLLTVSRAMAAAAGLREETRGSHWREDFPERDDARWSGHIDLTLEQGRPVTSFHAAPATDGALT
jgi:L-aspartate oxidase